MPWEGHWKRGKGSLLGVSTDGGGEVGRDVAYLDVNRGWETQDRPKGLLSWIIGREAEVGGVG